MMPASSLRGCRLLLASALLAAVPAFAAPATVAPAKIEVLPAIDAAVKAPTRDANNVKRDGFRHPAQTLSFFKVAPEKTVIEITPATDGIRKSWRRCCMTRATTSLRWSIRWRCPKAVAVTTSSAAATAWKEVRRCTRAVRQDRRGRLRSGQAGVRPGQFSRRGADLPQRAQLAQGRPGAGHVPGLLQRARRVACWAWSSIAPRPTWPTTMTPAMSASSR